MTRHRNQPGEPVTIRAAGPDDAEAVRRLAELDSARPLTGHLLLAEHHGEPLAAISLGAGSVVADPFRRSADAVHLLRLRRYQLLRQGGDTGTARSLVRRLLPYVAR
jgi:hypothetical protein